MEKGGISSARGTMRSGSRSPSFLAVALLIVLAILSFNYWSLSTRNRQLSNELETLQVDFRSVSDKHLTVEKRAANLASQLSETELKMKGDQSKLSEQEKKVQDLTHEVDTLKTQLQKANQDTEDAKKVVKTVQQEENNMAGELEKVKKQLTDLQNAPKVCSKNDCKEPIREVVGAVAQHVGKPALSGALKENVEVMQIAGDLLQGGEPPKAQLAPSAVNAPEAGKGPGKAVEQTQKVKGKP